MSSGSQTSGAVNCHFSVVRGLSLIININISPLRGDHAPEPIDMPFSVLTPVTDVIIPAKFYVDRLMGF